MKNERSSMCENYRENRFCVLEDTLRKTIKNIDKKPCNAKRNCGKNKVCIMLAIILIVMLKLQNF
jgi:hypothetical protein